MSCVVPPRADISHRLMLRKAKSTSGDTVQFVEQSLDTNLLNNAVRLRIPHCLLLPGGVYIQETLNNVLILIVTSQSVHRLVLPHPTRMYHSVSDRIFTLLS
ncbi:unnamed protein product [Leuciscus chuanchicus]